MKLFGFFKKGRESPPAGEEQSIKEVFRHFTSLLQANGKALELMADLEEKASGRVFFDLSYLQRTVAVLSEKVKDLVVSLMGMNPGKYKDLLEVYNRIHTEIQKALERRKRELPPADYTVPLNETVHRMLEEVGGKAAHLGEVNGKLGLPVPDGFVVTAQGYREFLSHNRLAERIRARLAALSPGGWEGIRAAGEEIRAWVLQSRIPGEMEDALRTSVEKLMGRQSRSAGLALRSSAQMEDGQFSFAGQYATFLNVFPREVTSKYKEIVASQFTAPALFYLKNKGLIEEEIAMAVFCQEFIRAKASGILFTAHPDPDHGETVLVNGLWGLGRLAVDGTASPDLYLLDKKGGSLIRQEISTKERMLVPNPEGGVQEQPVPEVLSTQACLEPGHLEILWKWALVLEEHFHHPQDVEWAMDEDGELYLLQTRGLRPAKIPEKEERNSSRSAQVRLEGGTRASWGVGSGRVFLVRSEEDLNHFPPGSVLVAVHASPKWAAVMDKAAAIVTDVGSATGHMAILAREFKVPALVDTKKATQVLFPEQEVTVDADYHRVYDGRIEELMKNDPPRDPLLRDTPVLKKLQEVLRLIGPLHLTDPQAPDFNARSCQTFHDLTRWAHEMAMGEMFQLAERGQSMRAVRIKTSLPLNLYAYDLGERFAPKSPGHMLLPEDLQSIPFRALWKGMTHPDVRWAGPVGIDMRGLFSVMTQSTIRPPEDYGDRTLALVSKNYLNFNSRLGYHFATVDSYCGPNLTDNYITFMFKGGAADQTRRGRRAQFIGRVLERLGFEVMVKEDLVKAQFRKFPPSSIEEKLDYLGRLMGCARLLDMTMSEENVVDRYVRSFLSGEYSLGEQGG
jgi:pyruvate, water dikinase